MSTERSPPSNSDLAAAAELRNLQASSEQTASAAQLMAEHDRKQAFRRLIDPGIFRPNPKEQAIASLKTLLTIADNLLREPDNPKYQRFKPTNSVIKRNLVDPKGSLEYAVELGFRPEVDNFQPYYAFNAKHMNDLRIGAAIIHEFLDLEAQKSERQALSKSHEKAARQAAAQKVKLAFMDDRKTKSDRDAMERQLREARQAIAAQQPPVVQQQETSSDDESDTPQLPGIGYVLGKSDSMLASSSADDAEVLESDHDDHGGRRKKYE